MLRVAHPPGYGAERRYAFDVVLSEFLGLEYELEEQERRDVEITLAGQPGSLVAGEGLFATAEDEWLEPESLPRLPLDRRDGLPVLYGGSSPDVFGSVFFLLTRYEEVANPARDEHERFPAEESIAAREGFLDRPLANEYVDLLWGELERRWPRLERKRRTFRALPSHDVDWPLCTRSTLKLAARAAAGDVVRRRDPALAVKQLRAFSETKRGGHAHDPCDTFDLIMDGSERRGLRSAFYFIAGHTAGEVDGTYSLDDPWIRALLRRIHERGHEIGLHPSYNTFRDGEATSAELAALRRVCEEEGIAEPVRGGRQHYLRWESPTTWQIWQDAGLEYDSSLGFAAQPGFRAGTCYEYPVFNLRTRQPLELRERPLVVMDRTLLTHQGLGPSRALEVAAELKRRCRRHDGDFTLLWHNSLLLTRQERRLYESVLDLD